jgi:DNA recombination-dependent growth factor C
LRERFAVFESIEFGNFTDGRPDGLDRSTDVVILLRPAPRISVYAFSVESQLTYFAHDFRYFPTQILAQQAESCWRPTPSLIDVAHEQGVVVLKVFRKVLAVQVVIELNEKVERLCEFQNRRRSGKRRCGIRRQQLIDTLFSRATS